MKVTVAKDLHQMYDHQYSDRTEEWRLAGAIAKASNIMSVLHGQKVNRAIEVGAGDGNLLKLLGDKKLFRSAVALEISQSALAQLRKKNISGLENALIFDGYSLPFEDNEFDLAICSHVLEHVEHPRVLLTELRRISKTQIIEVPIDFSINVDKKFEHFQEYGHINIYTPAQLRFLLRTVSYEIVRDKCSMYSYRFARLFCGKDTIRLVLEMIKILIWNTFTVLRRVKPHTYTILTK